MSGLSGELDDIISNEASARGPVLVEIHDTDIAFEFKGSGEWIQVDESYQPQVATSFGPGWWLVGVDIEPGLYRTEERVRYFARLSGLGGELDDILANEAGIEGPVVVEVTESDVAFETKGDATWSLVGDSYDPELKTTFGDGWWIVGVDILPGIYRTPDEVRYYARLSGFGNTIDDIIVNDASAENGAIIEIMETDVGFHTKGGATWSRIDLDASVASTTWGSIKSKFNRHD